jgi:DNA repair exonuclease SbcCD ATPase subunit
MSSVAEAALLDSQIRRIHHELRQSLEQLQQKETEAARLSPEIPALESRVAALQSELSSLESETAQFHSEIESLRRQQNEIDEQTKQIRELTSIFSEESESSSETLPPDLRAEVLAKADEIVEAIVTEYRGFDSADYERLLQENLEMQAAIDRELAVLNCVGDIEWENCDDFREDLDEFCQRYRPVDTRGESLSAVQVPGAGAPLEVLERRVNPVLPAPPRAQQLKGEITNLVALLRHQRGEEGRIYSDQLAFFERLKKCLDAASEMDIGAIEKQFRERVDMLNELNQIRPLQIPDLEPGENEGDPCVVIARHLGEFCGELRRGPRAEALVAEVEAAAEQALSIPNFTPPPPPKFIKQPVQSPDLLELASRLQAISERTREIVPIGAIRSLANSHREALAVEPVVVSSSAVPESAEDSKEEDIGADLAAEFAEFRRVAVSKLPPGLAKRFDLPDSSSLIPRIEEFECEEDDVENGLPLFETNLESRTATLNSLLRTMAAIELPTLPTIVEPIRAPRESAPIDSQPLLDAVEQVLSPGHQSPAAIADEIRELEMRLDAALKEIAACEEDECDESERVALEQAIASREQELEPLNRKVQEEVEIVKILKAERTRLTEQTAALQAQINEAGDLDEELRQAEAELSQKQAELRLKKKNLEEEEQLWAALHAHPVEETV